MTVPTRTERHLEQLCLGSFLRMWAHRSPYRLQRDNKKSTQGKELCDLIAVFENDVFLFSDKEIRWKGHARPGVAWSRWHKRAVLDSVKQLAGAERWLRSHPDRVFADRECSTRLPVALPEADVIRFHRIAVAHGSAGPNRREHGPGSGSLMINTLVGAERPFTVGREGPQDSFVHVLDEATLGLLLTNLDTLPEFRDYILAKERLLVGGTGIKAHGEEDLLAVYLTNMGIEDPSRHGFGDTKGVKVLEVPNGEWIRFEASAEKLARDAANVNSYLWDTLIDRFAKHSIEGTQHFTSASSPQQTERTLRILNAVPRTQRRALIDACLERISTFGDRSHRVWSARSADGTSAFTFLVVAREGDEEYEDYRKRRLYMLTMCTALDRIRNPEIPAHVGIGQGLPGNDHSEDVVLVDEQSWSQKLEEAAVSFRDEFGIRRDIRETHRTAHEYPVSAPKDEGRS